MIGYGSPNRAGTSKVHGEALGEDELKATKENLGWPLEPAFYVPDDVRAYFDQAKRRGAALEAAYNELLAAYAKAYPAEAAELQRMLAGELPDGWEEALPSLPAVAQGRRHAQHQRQGDQRPGQGAPQPDRRQRRPGGQQQDDDQGPAVYQAPATLAAPTSTLACASTAWRGILNGMALHGGVIPYGGTFLVFSDYMRGAMRLAAH